MLPVQRRSLSYFSVIITALAFLTITAGCTSSETDPTEQQQGETDDKDVGTDTDDGADTDAGDDDPDADDPGPDTGDEECETGYTGDDCSQCDDDFYEDADGLCIENCQLADFSCGDHGACNETPDGLACDCDTGYTGDSCSQCDSPAYYEGWEGVCYESCSIANLSCGQHGSCQEGFFGATCQCDTGYAGDNCSECVASYFEVDGECLSENDIGALVDEIVYDEMIHQNLIGLTTGVVVNNELAHVGAYGYADFQEEKPMTTDTMIRWASLSKPLTAVAAMQLYEDGHLDIDDDELLEDVSNWPDEYSDITMEQLLSNRSGIGHYDELDLNTGAYDETSPYDPDATLDVFNHEPLYFGPPGSQYRYTTFGFNLASAVIDHVARDAYGSWSGYPEVVDDHIADPVGMTTLQPDYSEFQDLSPRVTGYSQSCSQEYQIEDTSDVSYKLGGGGWISNITDLTLFAEGLLQEEFLDEETQEMMWKTHEDNHAEDESYGLGFRTNTDPDQTLDRYGAQVFHGGSQQNTRTYMRVFPDFELAVVLMTNSRTLDRSRIYQRIANAMGRGFDIDERSSMYDILDCDDDCAGTSDKYFSGVWQAGNTPTVIRRGYSHSDFLTERNRLRDLGWLAVDFETYVDSDGQRRWDGLFKEMDSSSAIWRNFTTDGFFDKWEEMNDAGQRLIDVETYEIDGNRRWAGLFHEGSGPTAFYYDWSTSEFESLVEDQADLGYKLIDIETYEDDGDQRWAGVWGWGDVDQEFVHGLEFSEFADKRADLHDEGYRLVDLETYIDDGFFSSTQYWAGVFDKVGGTTERINRNVDYCTFLERHEGRLGSFELTDLEHRD